MKKLFVSVGLSPKESAMDIIFKPTDIMSCVKFVNIGRKVVTRDSF